MQQHYPRALRTLLVCALIGCIAPFGACSSMKALQPVTTPGEPIYGPLKAGDTVVVETRDGEQWRFVVQEVDGEVIVAPGGVRYARQDIVRVQRKSFSGPKTFGLIAGIVGGYLVLLSIVVASAYGDLLGGGL